MSKDILTVGKVVLVCSLIVNIFVIIYQLINNHTVNMQSFLFLTSNFLILTVLWKDENNKK